MASRRALHRLQRTLCALVEALEPRKLLTASPDSAPFDDDIPTDPNFPPALQLVNRWTNTAAGSTGAQGTGITLTWSIVPDGTILTSGVKEPNTPSDFQARMNSLYGASSNWMPIVQQVFNEWSAITGVTFVNVSDDGVAYSSINANGSNTPGATRGDIRIGAHVIDGTFNTLAYNWFPDFGDMVIDSADLGAGGFMADTSNNSLKLRNVMAHELGHALGLNHVDPINQTKLMEAFASTAFDGPQFDDMYSVNRNYGDIYEKGVGDNSAANAVSLGTLNNGTSSLTNLSLATTGDLDYYKLTTTAAHEINVTVSPFGPTYLEGPQGGTTSLFNAMNQMDLEVQLLASNGTTVIWTASDTGVGGSENIDFGSEPAGIYFIKVLPAPGAVDSTQMYTLSTVIGNPVANTTTVSLDGSNNLLVTDSAAGGKNDAVSLVADGTNNRFIIKDTNSFLGTTIGAATGGGMHTVYVPFSAVTGPGVTINTLAGNDTINVTSLAKQVTVNAGADTDTINILETSVGVPVIIMGSAGGDAVNINTDNTGSAAALFPVSQAIGALTIGSGGLATLSGTSPNPPAEVLVTTALTLTGTAKLNIVNNDVIVDYTGTSPIGTLVGSNYTSITGYIQSGRNGGAWNGNGIITSMTAAMSATPVTTIGVAEASTVFNNQTGVFDSTTVDTTAVLIKYTYGGDANLSGSITGDDYFQIDAGFATPSSGWSNGDFDYNGRIDADDYFRIDNNYNKSTTPLFAPPLSLAAAASTTPMPPTLATTPAYQPPPNPFASTDDPSDPTRLIDQLL